MIPEQKAWWKNWRTYTSIGLGVLAFSPELIDWAVKADLLKDYTLLAKLGVPLGILVKILNLKAQYKMDNLPSGITKVMDKIPDKYTGVKGSDK